MSKRISIVLPDIAVDTIDRLAGLKQRSRFINDAVLYFVAHRSAKAIRARLQGSAVRDQDLDREILREWSAMD